MERPSTYFTDLITRYFSGEATPEEVLELEAWVKAAPANRDEFASLSRVWQSVQSTRPEDPAATGAAWENVKERISKPSAEPQVMPFRRKNLDIQRSIFDIRYSFQIRYAFRIAAVVVLLLLPAFFLYRYLSAPAEMVLSALDAPAEHILPDGSHVTLNAGATLVCPGKFSGTSRNVRLDGEAWFEVTHDARKPFIVAAGDARIRVLGTTFSVNTRTLGGTREVILATGKVKVYFEEDPANMVLLDPGERAEVASTGQSIMKDRNHDPNFLAWKTRHLEFSNTPLNEVAALLTKVYHTPVRLSGNGLSNCRITATFDKQSLESVIHVLQATLDLQIRNTGAGIELSGRGCN